MPAGMLLQYRQPRVSGVAAAATPTDFDLPTSKDAAKKPTKNSDLSQTDKNPPIRRMTWIIYLTMTASTRVEILSRASTVGWSKANTII